MRRFSLIASDMRSFLYPQKPFQEAQNSTITFKKFLLAWFSIEFRVALSYRVQNFLFKKGYKKLALYLYLRSKKKHGCDIHFEADISQGFRIGHASDIVIGPGVSIGKGAVVFNGVTLGNRFIDSSTNMPTVGSFVTISTGAKILGEITIGNYAKIGANAVVLKAIPEKHTFVGIGEKKLVAPKDAPTKN